MKRNVKGLLLDVFYLSTLGVLGITSGNIYLGSVYLFFVILVLIYMIMFKSVIDEFKIYENLHYTLFGILFSGIIAVVFIDDRITTLLIVFIFTYLYKNILYKDKDLDPFKKHNSNIINEYFENKKGEKK